MLSDVGKLHSCRKSQLVSILEADTKLEASAIIVDGAALINTMPPHATKILKEYETKDVIPTVEAFTAIYRRTYIVFDVFSPTCLKAETRSKHGQGT